MFELARDYKDRGMAAYSELQQAEFAAEKDGYTATRHQREVGTGYFDQVAEVISGGKASTLALERLHRGPPVLTREQLVEDLRRLGVNPGDFLMVHASLRKIGPVEGGVSGVLDALDAAVGPDGTLMMTLGARNDWGWVNERPESERAGLLADAVPFDAASTPAQEDVGYLAEAFRQRPGTLVSDHPEGRFGARGRQAAAVLSNPPWNDYYGPGSPLEHAWRSGVRVLRLGADLGTVTLLHLAEYLVELPSKRRVRRYDRVHGPHGPEVRTVDCLDDEFGIVDHEGEDYFGLILRDYLAQGRARTGKVGNAVSELLEGADIVPFGVRWMAEHFG